MTVLSLAASDVALLLPGEPRPCEFKEDVDDMADAAWAREDWPGLAYAKPLLNGGGSYVTPNSGWTQKGHAAGSETNAPSS